MSKAKKILEIIEGDFPYIPETCSFRKLQSYPERAPQIREDFEIRKVLKRREFPLYVLKTELVALTPDEEPIEMESAYNHDGNYIGDKKMAKLLCDKYGIVPETSSPGNNVCSIGFSDKDGKWYGWSHRAIFGFKVGSKVTSKDHLCASSGYTAEYLADHPEENRSLPVGFVAKTLKDAKRMAIAFADAVS